MKTVAFEKRILDLITKISVNYYYKNTSVEYHKDENWWDP